MRNPWGRKGKPVLGEDFDDFASEMREGLERPIHTKDGKTFSHAELILNCVFGQIGRGDLKAVPTYIALRDRYGYKAAPVDLAAGLEDDRKLLVEASLRRLEAKRANGLSDYPNGSNEAVDPKAVGNKADEE